MGTRVLTIRNLNAYDHLISNGPQFQCVRWKRKPIWLPPAKSKLYKIPQKPVIPEEEAEELKRLNNNYKTFMKSLRYYFVMRDEANRVNYNPETVKTQAEQDFLRCSKINEAWNKRVAEEREERLAKERDERKQQILLKLEAKEQRDIQIKERVEEVVRKAKEQAPTFITSENIDEAIEKALGNIVNHNYAIDINGNVHTENAETSETAKKAEARG